MNGTLAYGRTGVRTGLTGLGAQLVVGVLCLVLGNAPAHAQLGIGDICAANGWYGDLECDTFCPLPDPDCDVGDICAANGWYGDLECDTFCPLPDPDCDVGDICAANGWYGDGECDTFCPLPDPDCSPSISLPPTSQPTPQPTPGPTIVLAPPCGAMGSIGLLSAVLALAGLGLLDTRPRNACDRRPGKNDGGWK